MTRTEVISAIADFYNLKRNVDFANFFDIPKQNALYWLRGGFNVYAVYAKCPDINPEWLLSDGEVGEMVRQKKSEEEVMHEDCRRLLERSLENVDNALARVAEEQAISKQVLSHTDKVIELVRSTTKE